MGYLLDTNVVSELRRPRPHGGVLAWIQSVDDADFYLSSVTIGEIQVGIELTREQSQVKANEIEQWLDQVCNTFTILTMDGPAFRRLAKLMHCKSHTLYEDAMTAAITKVHHLTVVADVRRLVRCLALQPGAACQVRSVAGNPNASA